MADAGLPDSQTGINRYEVGRFTHKAARLFMTQAGLGLQPDALEQLLTSAAKMDDTPELIRPITLNVLGHVLSEGKASAPSLEAGPLVQHYTHKPSKTRSSAIFPVRCWSNSSPVKRPNSLASKPNWWQPPGSEGARCGGC